MTTSLLLCLMLLILIIALLLNIPIAFSLLIATIIPVLLDGKITTNLLIQTFYDATNTFSLLAIPLFILAGEIMSKGGLANRLIRFLESLLLNVRGRLGIITIVACLIFAAISGSGPATVASIGGIMIPYMIKNGYPASYAASLAAGTGALGPIIPPSIVLIVYGVMASVSIGDLFIAGIIPGILIGISFLIVNYFILKIKLTWIDDDLKSNTHKEKKRFKNFLKELNNAKFSLLAPVIILGGIYAGIVTPTEAATIAVVYSLIVGMFIYKEINLKVFYSSLKYTSLISGQILIFIGTATFFGKVITLNHVPQYINDYLFSFTDNKIIILLFINLLLLLVGMFVETIAAVLIFVPLLLPITNSIGVDPVHFGIIIAVNLSTGMLTPPLGINLFVASNIAKIKFESTIKFLLIIVFVMVLDILIITYIPSLSLYLPSLMK